MATDTNKKAVFINCPFDDPYKKIFDAIVFAIHDLGFQARHALIDNDEPQRLSRIAKEIFKAKYSIHDISRIKLSGPKKMPRFNMPFEAGIAYADQKKARVGEKHFLLLDSKKYQYLASMSDVAGLDAKVHTNKPELAIKAVRQFLQAKSGIVNLPGDAYIAKRHTLFFAKLRALAKAQNMTVKEVRSWDYVNDLQALMAQWIAKNPP